ncbi:hypothetical protein RQP46_005237 [Phenoliferia psychrophenolica]
MPVIPTTPTPLFIHAPVGGFVNVPPPWTCPESHLSWGGGVPPWNIYTIHSSNYSSIPLEYLQLQIFNNTLLDKGSLPNTDAWDIGDDLAMLIQDSQGSIVISNHSTVASPWTHSGCNNPDWAM